MATTDRAPACSARAPTVRDQVVIDVEMVRVRRMARVLDRYMLDPILGAVLPGAGDMIGSLLGLYAVSLAIRRRMSPVVIARMLLNLSIDALLGIVPAIGDLFDLAFRANERNVELLLAHAATGGRATWRDWLAVIGAALAFVATVGLAIYAAVAVVRWIA